LLCQNENLQVKVTERLNVMNIQTRQIEFVNLKKQYASIKEEIDEAINYCLENTAFIGGAEVEKFANNFAQFCDADYCVPCANGTDALEMVLQAFKLKPGDEVIVPANSFAASAEAVSNNGATVVFCDVNPGSYNMDVNQLEKQVTSKTKVIMPVHLFGRIADMQAIKAIAYEHNLKIVEDASQAHGAFYKNKPVGYFADAATFSFYPGKNLGAYGDAGAVITDNQALHDNIKKIANHGRIAKYDHEIIGRNSRMDGLQAAILNVKLKYLQQWTARRSAIAALYTHQLENVPGLITPKNEMEEQPAWHLYVVRVAEKNRPELVSFLKDKGIATGIHYPIALHQLEAYKFLNHKPDDFPVASDYSKQVLSLPIYAELEDEEVYYITNCIKDFFS